MAIRQVKKRQRNGNEKLVDEHCCDRCGSTRDLKERDVDGRRYLLCGRCRARLGPMAGVRKVEP